MSKQLWKVKLFGWLKELMPMEQVDLTILRVIKKQYWIE